MSDFIFIVLALLITALLAWFIGYLCTRSQINKLQAERDDIFNKLNESEGKTRFLMSEKQKLEGDNETLNLKIGDLRIQSDNLGKELNAANTAKMGLLGQVDSLKSYETRFKQTNTQLKATEGQLSALQLDYNNLKSENQSINNNLQKRIAELAALAASVKILNEIKSKYNILEPRSQRMEKEIEELNGKLKASKAQNIALDATIKESDTLILGLRGELEGSQASLAAVTDEKSAMVVQLKNNEESSAKLAASLATMEMRLNDATNAEAELRSQLSTIQAQLKESENNKAQLEALLAATKGQLKTSNENGLHLFEELSAIRAALVNSQENADYLSIQLTDIQGLLQANEAKLKNSKELNAKAAEQLKSIFAKLKATEEEGLKMAIELEDASKTNEAHKAQIADLGNENADLKGQLETGKRTGAEAAATIALLTGFKAKYQDLSNEYESLQLRFKELEGKMDKEETSNYQLSLKLEEAQRENHSYINQFAELGDFKSKFEATEADKGKLAGELSAMNDKYNALLADKYDLSNELEALKSKMPDYNSLLAEKYDLSNELEALKSKMPDYNSLLAEKYDLSNELEALKSKMPDYNGLLAEKYDLSNELEALKSSMPDYNSLLAEKYDLSNELEALKSKMPDYNALLAEKYDLSNELEALKSKMPDYNALLAEKYLLASEIEGLKATLADIAVETEKIEDKLDAVEDKVDAVEDQIEDVEATLEAISQRAELINFDRIGLATDTDKDDLKLIKGIGAFSEQKLNALGIYKFSQVANFTDDDVQSVTKAIEFFPGRIVRDKWVAQAKELMNMDAEMLKIRARGKSINFNKLGVYTYADRDPLQKIKGIGPFIEQKLHALGIYTFDQIAKLDDEVIQQVTDGIQFFPGRIQRDNWLDQGIALHKEKEEAAKKG